MTRKSSILSAIAVSLLLLHVTAAFAVPRIQFENELIDFGSVVTGKSVTINFKFQNVGDADLEITNVVAGCGCTNARALESKVAPGKSSAIEAVLDSTGFIDRITKSVTVSTNDPEKSMLLLQITGEVIGIAKINPQRINFGSIKKNTTTAQNIEVVPVDPATFTIAKVDSTGPNVKVSTFKKTSDKNGVRWIIPVTIKATDYPGRITENVVISTKSTPVTKLNVLVFGNVVE